jgi:Ca2+-transporting ATPase
MGLWEDAPHKDLSHLADQLSAEATLTWLPEHAAAELEAAEEAGGWSGCSYLHEGVGAVKASTMAMSVLVTIEMLNALNALSEHSSLFQMPPWCNPLLLLAIAASMAIHALILYVPGLNSIFEITWLDGSDWLVVLAWSFPVIVLEEVMKLIGRVWDMEGAMKRKKSE